MPRISLADPIADDLGELLAAATNGRRPPLNLHLQMASAPVVLAAYAGIRRATPEYNHGYPAHWTTCSASGAASRSASPPTARRAAALDDLVGWATRLRTIRMGAAVARGATT